MFLLQTCPPGRVPRAVWCWGAHGEAHGGPRGWRCPWPPSTVGVQAVDTKSTAQMLTHPSAEVRSQDRSGPALGLCWGCSEAARVLYAGLSSATDWQCAPLWALLSQPTPTRVRGLLGCRDLSSFPAPSQGLRSHPRPFRKEKPSPHPGVWGSLLVWAPRAFAGLG